MGRKRSKATSDREDDGSENPLKSTFAFSDSYDAEANEDLSLRIVEKAISRASSSGAAGRIGGSGDDDHVKGSSRVPADGSGSVDIVTTELVAPEKSVEKKKSKEKKKRKTKKLEAEVQMDTDMEEEEKVSGNVEAVDSTKISQLDAAENSDNLVLKRLLRGPRYFDPPDSSWGACFNCGEEGHSAVNCTSARRKKPCFICGSFEHGAKQCEKGKSCFICKEGGHQAKDCPKKFKKCSQGLGMCLKCGSPGHVMSSCNNNYSPNDLKGIQCYVCKSFGHLCCVNYNSDVSSELSCYRCGQPGHSGLACRGSRGETTVVGSPSACYKCGEVGHFARECTNLTKVRKRSHDLSTPKKKSYNEDKGYKGCKSAPQHLGKSRKKKKLQYDEDWSNSSSKRKARDVWIMDDPWDFPRGKADITNGCRSPFTPTGKNHRTLNYSVGTLSSNPWSARKPSGSYSRTPNSQGPSGSFQHRYSASRFGSSSGNGMRRNYDWW